MNMNHRYQPRSVAKACLAALAVLIAAEMTVRLFFSQDALLYRDSENPILRFELLPGSAGQKVGVTVSISEDGMREVALAAPKPENERRVVVVGGQETFGIGVEEPQLFVRLAGSGLDADGRVRTVNLSMYSYNLVQKVELACERLSRLQPEIVVLQSSDNDGGDLPPPAMNAPRLKNWVREHSALARRAAEVRYLWPSPPSAGVEVVDIKAQLRRFHDCVKAAGAVGAVMMISRPSGDGTVSRTARGLKESALELGIPYIDAGAAIRHLPAGERTLKAGSPFLSPAAHRATAAELQRLIKPLLRRKKPLSRPTRPAA